MPKPKQNQTLNKEYETSWEWNFKSIRIIT